MKKVLILLVLSIICWLIISPLNTSKIPVFLMTEENEVITKGYYGSVFIVEITFEQSSLSSFIEDPVNAQTLFLLDKDFISRAPHITKLLIEHNRQVGLLLYEVTDLESALQLYIDTFKKQPLWVRLISEDTEQLQRLAFSHQLNVLAPTMTLGQSFPKTVEKGSFVSLLMDEQQELKTDALLTWMKTQSFISIEESLFGYKASSEKKP